LSTANVDEGDSTLNVVDKLSIFDSLDNEDPGAVSVGPGPGGVVVPAAASTCTVFRSGYNTTHASSIVWATVLSLCSETSNSCPSSLSLAVASAVVSGTPLRTSLGTSLGSSIGSSLDTSIVASVLTTFC